MIKINVLINLNLCMEFAHIGIIPITTTGKCMCTPFISLPRFDFRHIGVRDNKKVEQSTLKRGDA